MWSNLIPVLHYNILHHFHKKKKLIQNPQIVGREVEVEKEKLIQII